MKAEAGQARERRGEEESAVRSSYRALVAAHRLAISAGPSSCGHVMRSITPSMAEHGVRRIIAISTFGAGNTRPQVGLLARSLLFGLVLRSEVADKEAMERQLSETDLQWTVVRVGLLIDGPARGTWRTADDNSIRGMGKIARADVAFMLDQLESQTWVRRKPVIMY